MFTEEEKMQIEQDKKSCAEERASLLFLAEGLIDALNSTKNVGPRLELEDWECLKDIAKRLYKREKND